MCALVVGLAIALLSQPANAFHSINQGAPWGQTHGRLDHVFTDQQWEASNFASEKDIQRFRDAKYGMFIHFGLSTHNNAELSWGMCKTRKAPDVGTGPIPDEIWTNYHKDMKLEKLDVKEWVRIAERAGFKYIVVIAKHHEGFHMWDTALSDFKITNTPFGRDFLKEFVDACHEANMPVGIYYSQRDWYHPDYMPVDPEKVERKGVRWTLKPGYQSPLGQRHSKYIDYQNKAVEELCTQYGKIDFFWWDAHWFGGMFTSDMWDAEAINRKIRKWQPGIVINNRCSIPGDFDTPEQRLGNYQDWRPWESCMCLTKSWSYSGTAPKSRDQIIRMIVNNACGDGNVLLSWGPKWDGEFAAAEKERLFEVGDWLKQNGAAIYGTRGGPWKLSSWGGSVRKGNRVYLHVVEWNGDTLRLPAIPDRKVIAAKLLNSKEIAFKQTDSAIYITVPEDQQTAPDTIVELAMNRTVEGIEAVDSTPPSVFNSAEYGQIVSHNATVRTSSSDEQYSEGSPRNLVAEKPVDDFAFHTSKETNPWVEIDLGSEFDVTGVRVVNRESCCQDRAATLALSVSSDCKQWQPVWKTEEAKSVWEVPVTSFHAGIQVPGRKARYIRLEIHPAKPTPLHLRHVQIYGKE